MRKACAATHVGLEGFPFRQARTAIKVGGPLGDQMAQSVSHVFEHVPRSVRGLETEYVAIVLRCGETSYAKCSASSRNNYEVNTRSRCAHGTVRQSCRKREWRVGAFPWVSQVEVSSCLISFGFPKITQMETPAGKNPEAPTCKQRFSTRPCSQFRERIWR